MISALLLSAAAASAAPSITPAEIRRDVRTLSSDAFAGRGPGEVGEQKTIAYLERRFAEAGLEPGGADGGWLQAVPLVRLDRAPGATMTLMLGGRPLPLMLGRTASLGLTTAGTTELANAPLVFAGFGIVDPGKGYDAFAGTDMRGKVAVVLANDPDFEAGRDLGFEGRRLTVAGRVGSKFAAAARAGAAGVLVIHEDAAASYPFSQIGSGDALPAFVPAPMAASPLRFSGWLERSAWTALLAQAGLDLDRLKAEARQPGFRARPIAGAAVSVSGTLRATPVTSHNVIARLRGAERPDEAVLYGAHWDANGTNGPDARGDAIRNGAVDNGIGTAELLAVAGAFARGPRPARTVIFAAWTAEEKGLLGAEYYAAHPLHPIARTAAVINLDPHVALPQARTVELIGGGRTDLEAIFAQAAAARGLTVAAEPNPEAGWYFRSDHYALAKRGVPALAFRIGRDLAKGGTAAGEAIVSTYNARCYHQPCDQFDANWDAVGAAQEANVALDVGRAVANGSAWPRWMGDEFGTVRATTAAERR